jgi:hypothetical protein
MLRYDVHPTSTRGSEMSSPKRNPDRNAGPRPSVQLTTEAVVASYIHEISERHRADERAAVPPPPPDDDRA